MSASGERRLLKILHIDPERNWGGGEAQVLGLLTYLAKQGHRQYLLAHPQGQLWPRAQDSNVSLIPMIARNDLAVRPAWAIRRLIQRENFDIVHLHTKRAHALAAWFAAGSRRAKFVVTRRMDYPEKSSARARWLYNRGADGVVAISQKIADLLRDAGVEERKIRVVYSGIEPARFRRPRLGSTPVGAIVGTVAVLEERKGLRYLIEAAAQLREQGLPIEYRIAGAGPLSAELQELARRLGVADRVQFCGFVSDPAAFLAELDIFVMPSLFEGLGVAALEAMAAGKPVVASKVGGLAESVLDGETGLLVEPGDAAALADAILQLLQAPERAAGMGRRGAARVEQRFSLDQMARTNEAFYYELLAQS
ncbi:MAG: glycosyltransferase [Deltaproteobacteria bacterium]|nr:glycosyltransferase [Deltaproteobacteria bacterium]